MTRLTITYVVSSDSSERLHLAKQLVTEKVRPECVHEDIGEAKDRVYVEHRKVGDYFSSVQIADDGPTSFRVVFEPCPNADRYWKDLVVHVLASLRDSGLLIRYVR